MLCLKYLASYYAPGKYWSARGKVGFSTKPAVHFNHKAKSVRTVVDTNVAKPTTRSLRPRVNKNYKS